MARRCLAALIGLALVLIVTMWPHQAAAATLPQSAPCATAAASALAQRGKPYIWGAKGPNAFDCSGLTSYAWMQAGVSIGLSTYDQAQAGVPIPCRLTDLAGENTTCWAPGDLIFLRYRDGQHVAMYVGSGLFADAYNQATGVIVHDVVEDSFYAENFWQARRIVDCGTVSVPLVFADPFSSSPDIEYVPDILSYISYSVPQCGQCNVDGSVLLPQTNWDGVWPSGWEIANLPVVFRTAISWLAWRVSEMIRDVVCWLLFIAQIVVNFLTASFNIVIFGLNELWRMFVFSWLSARSMFYGLWDLIEAARSLLFDISSGIDQLLIALGASADILLAVLDLVGQLIGLILSILGVLIGLIAYVGGLGIGLISIIIDAITGSSYPVQLGETHIVYLMVRGSIEGLLASPITWMVLASVGFAYVRFIFWFSHFLTKGRD